MQETIKGDLLALLEGGRAREQAFWGTLTDGERTATGSLAHWSAKDTFAHIIAWKEDLAKRLELAYEGKTPERITDFDAANEAIYEANQQIAWGELAERENAVFDRLIRALQALPDETLEDRERFAWTGSRALWRSVVFTAYLHPFQHISAAMIARGDMESALELEEGAAKAANALDPSPDWRGFNLYNLACFYALQGMAEKALETVESALELNPGLKKWSRKDPDLDALRELPAFQALLE